MMGTILCTVNIPLFGDGPLNGKYTSWENDLDLIAKVIQYECVNFAGGSSEK